MTTGIYALYWEEEDLIYIGQSVNIETRFNDHLSSLRRKRHFNYKVQGTYNRFGPPTCIILETTSQISLDSKEENWIVDTKATLNITSGGSSGGKGIYHSQFKFTELQILLAFRYLSSTTYKTNKEIFNITGISIGMLEAIISGKAHIWLKEEYPYRYKLMQIRRKERALFNNKETKSIEKKYKLLGKELPVVLSPTGEEITVLNIREFARNHKLPPSSVNYMINGKRAACKGWKLKTT